MGYTGQRPSAIPLTTADIVDGTITNDDLAGSITSAKITSLDATKLTGTVADARFPATLPAISGANLTSLPSEITKQSAAPTVSSPATPTVGDLILATSTGQMYSCSVVSSGANQWLNIGDGTGSILPVFTATGGTTSTYSYGGVDYKLHKFTATGTTNFVVSQVLSGSRIDVLVIAGGGGGAGGRTGASNGGGGAAGGLRWFTTQTPTASTYVATVGAGGAGTAADTGNGTKGTNSSFIGSGISITGTGGGYGAYDNTAGGNGGSSGGSSNSPTPAAGNEGSYTPVEGFTGGTGDPSSGGGGGGSGGVGQNTSGGSHGGVGEDNFLNQSSTALTVAATKALLDSASIGEVSGSSRHIAGGGAGGASSASNGGTGGGGNSGSSYGAGTTGDVNTGSGGGGGGHNSAGAAGGSGIVIIRYTV
jgi:hypothetical protein